MLAVQSKLNRFKTIRSHNRSTDKHRRHNKSLPLCLSITMLIAGFYLAYA
jgi:hypothetical protein